MISSGLQVAAASWSFHLGSRAPRRNGGAWRGFAVGHEHVIWPGRIAQGVKSRTTGAGAIL